MLEAFIATQKHTEGVEVSDLTFYFLEPGRTISDGAIRDYVGVVYVELFDGAGSKITLDDSQFSASSYYDAVSQSYPPYYANWYSDDYQNLWLSAKGNNGNPNKSCWLRISAVNKVVSRIRISLNAYNACRYFSIEDRIGSIGIVDVRHLGTNFYPIHPDYPNTTNNGYVDVILLS